MKGREGEREREREREGIRREIERWIEKWDMNRERDRGRLGEKENESISPCMQILKSPQTNMPSWQGSVTACHRSCMNTCCCEETPSSSSRGGHKE